MERAALEALLEAVREGHVPVTEAAARLGAVLPTNTASRDPHLAGVAHLDHHRALRCGFPEVVLGSSKTPADLVRIASAILERSSTLLVTRVDAPRAEALLAAFPDAEHHERARAVSVLRDPPARRRPGVLVLCAGTGDVPVAEEARVTAWAMGEEVETRYDVGVAGLHRILGEVETLRRARAIVVAAGMDGALPSVVGGLVGVPVIAVPTSVGYGLSLDGVAPLLTMLNACAPGVSVVNVDNGFGAGYLAALVNRAAAAGPDAP
ncbi:MAG: nickel pincer cofactor biosynthesis protein LarB [Planctomycetota bacterium]